MLRTVTESSPDEKRRPLRRERVLRGAVEVADAAGVGSLTMRSLAQHLGVKPMALYDHVANKSEILDGIVDLVFGEIELPSPRRRLAGRHGAASAFGPPGASMPIPGRSDSCSRAPLLARRRSGTTMRSSVPCGGRASR